MNPNTIEGLAVTLPVDDIDTDVIIPQTHLVTPTKADLKEGLFFNWRDDLARNVVSSFHKPYLIAGQNFGCGSSREHAVWALLAHGFRVIVATGFGDIFRRNCFKNGLIAVDITRDERLQFIHAADSNHALNLDLRTRVLSCGGTSAPFAISDAEARNLAQDSYLTSAVARVREVVSYERTSLWQ